MHMYMGFPGSSTVKNLPAMRETWVQSLGQEDPTEKEMATHSSILAWEIPWTEEPGRLQPMGLQRVRHGEYLQQQQQQETRKRKKNTRAMHYTLGATIPSVGRKVSLFHRYRILKTPRTKMPWESLVVQSEEYWKEKIANPLPFWYDFEFYAASTVCWLLFPFQNFQIASLSILSRFYSCTEWERNDILTFFHAMYFAIASM